MAGEGTEEFVVGAGGQFGHGEGNGGFFAAADEFGVGDYALVAGFHIIVVRACAYAVVVHAVHVAFGGNHDVMPHRGFGRAASVFEGNGEVGAAFGHVDFGGVVLHAVAGFHQCRAAFGSCGGGRGGFRGRCGLGSSGGGGSSVVVVGFGSRRVGGVFAAAGSQRQSGGNQGEIQFHSMVLIKTRLNTAWAIIANCPAF